MANESKEDDLNQTSPNERLYRAFKFIAKSSAGSLAPVGLSSIANEIFDLIVSDPAVRRRDRFIMDSAARIAALEEAGQISLESLLDNEESAAILLRAVQAAMRSSGEQKLNALQEAALKGILSSVVGKGSSSQIVIGLLDQMTEYHVILLLWEFHPRNHYTLGQLQSKEGDEARRSYFYGQPVHTNPKELKNPVSVFKSGGWGLYVEREDSISFRLAREDLIAMNLLEPVLKKEEYKEGRMVRQRNTPDIAGYQVSELGAFVCEFIRSDDGLSNKITT